MKRIFFISDTHFFHNNIIKYTNRPFKNVEEMNETIKNNWNSVVNHNDLVFHLGDVALTKSSNYIFLSRLIKQLNGTKILIVGNHDQNISKKDFWLKVFGTLNINYKNYKISMKHTPWKQIEKNKIFLHGHVHGKFGPWYNNQIDMSIENWNYTPVSIEKIIEFWEENRKF